MLWSLARSKVAVVSQNVAVAGPKSRSRLVPKSLVRKIISVKLEFEVTE